MNIDPGLYNRGGFSAVEMLVTTSIIIIISVVVLLNYAEFDDNASFNITVEKLIVTLREAQIYGIAVKEEEGTTNFFPSYGIYFDESTPSNVVLFADFNENQVYDAPGELVTTHEISKPYVISDVCVDFFGTDCTTSIVSVTYKRPEPKAVIRKTDGGPTFIAARIHLSSPRGSTRTVYIDKWGYIRRL